MADNRLGDTRRLIHGVLHRFQAARKLPQTRLGLSAQSPIAKMRSSGVRKYWSTVMPFPTGKPASIASSTFGTTPIPAITRSAGRRDSFPQQHFLFANSEQRRIQQDVDALVLVLAAEVFRHHRRDHARHKPRLPLDHGDLLAQSARRGGDFESDESAADHDDILRGGQALADLGRFGERAQVADAVGSHIGKHPVARAGGQHQRVVFDVLSRIERHAPRHAIDGCHSARHQIYALGLVERGRAQLGMALLLFAEQKTLRERRPLVRNAGLVADQRDPFFVTLGAQGRGGLKTALSSANDDDAHLALLLVGGVWTTRPSNSAFTWIWQLRRLLDFRGEAVVSSIASSILADRVQASEGTFPRRRRGRWRIGSCRRIRRRSRRRRSERRLP